MVITLEDGRRISVPNSFMTEIEKYDNKNKYFHDIEIEDEYYIIGSDGLFRIFYNHKDLSDSEYHDNLNAFTDRDFAEKVANRQLLERKLLKYSLEHNGDANDWNDFNSYKYYIYYDHDTEKLTYSSAMWSQGCGLVHFNNAQIVEDAIELFKDDLVKYFTEWVV